MDNASSNDAAISQLKTRLPNLLLDGRYLHVRCLAHIINLIVKDGLKAYDETIDRVRNAVKHIRQTPIRFQNFKACAVEKKIESKALLSLDCTTRWNNTCEMLERAVVFEKAFELYDQRYKSYKADLGEIPNKYDWLNAKKMADLLGVFKQKTEKISGSTYAIAHQFFLEVMDVADHLDQMTKEKDQLFDFARMTSTMRHKFDKYFGDEGRKNMLFEFAVILDPHMKLQIIQFQCERTCLLLRVELDKTRENKVTDEEFKKMVEMFVNDVKNEMECVVNEYDRLYGNTNNEPPKTQNKFEHYLTGENSFLNAFKKYRGDGAASLGAKTELEKYLKDDAEESTSSFDILTWWKVNSTRYPTLSRMAKAIPVSTVASESAFSTGRRVLNPYRSLLSPPLVQALICTQN